MATQDGLSPDDFAATATRAVAGCAGLDPVQQGERLAGDGLLGVMAAETVGGLDLPLAFAVPVVAAASAGLLSFPLSENLVLARLLQQQLPRVAQAIVTGTDSATIAWNGSVKGDRKGDQVTLNGWVGRAPSATTTGLLVVRLGEDAAALVPMKTAGVAIEPAAGLDLAQSEHVIQLSNVAVPAENCLPAGSWTSLQSDATLLRAAAILGSAQTCLALAQEHVSTRRQFGHALSYNQAIRHSLARHKLALEGIRQAIARALWCEPGTKERQAAFLAASSYGVLISEGAVQMHGGMGFTWDVPVHRHVRHIRALQTQGDASGLLAAFGQRYIADVEPALV